MGELLDDYRRRQQHAEQLRDSEDQRLRNALIDGLPRLARKAMAEIKRTGHYNRGHKAGWKDRTVALHWRGQEQLAWKLRDLYESSFSTTDRYVALVETADLVVVTNETGAIELFDPRNSNLSAEQLGSIWVTILDAVDVYAFREQHFATSLDEFIERIMKV